MFWLSLWIFCFKLSAGIPLLSQGRPAEIAGIDFTVNRREVHLEISWSLSGMSGLWHHPHPPPLAPFFSPKWRPGRACLHAPLLGLWASLDSVLCFWLERWLGCDSREWSGLRVGWAADGDSSLNDRKHMLDIWGLQIDLKSPPRTHSTSINKKKGTAQTWEKGLATVVINRCKLKTWSKTFAYLISKNFISNSTTYGREMINFHTLFVVK